MKLSLFSLAAGLMLALAPHPVLALDVNKANAAELLDIRGIGPSTAQRIIDERERAGPFQSWSDLSDRVRGIGVRKAAALRTAGLDVSPPAGAGTPSTAANKEGAR